MYVSLLPFLRCRLRERRRQALSENMVSFLITLCSKFHIIFQLKLRVKLMYIYKYAAVWYDGVVIDYAIC